MTGAKKNFFPLKVFVLLVPENTPYPVKMLVSVPKRNIKSAVKRNRVKRLIRECWRTSKNILYQPMNDQNLKANVMLLYMDKEVPEKKVIESKISFIFSFILDVTLKQQKKN